MAEIGIYGGTFNPVHKEHVAIVEKVKKQFGLKKVIVVPSNVTPAKKTWSVAFASDRLNMLRLAFADCEGVTVSDYETLRDGESYTYVTLEHFRNVYPSDKLYFIMGADAFKTFSTWKYPERIVSAADIIVVDRKNSGVDTEKLKDDFSEKFGKTPFIAEYEGKEVSSTYIKCKKYLGLYSDDIDEKVQRYIDERGIYLSPYYNAIKSNLKDSRIVHTAGVIYCALSKQAETGLDPEKIVTACSLHDIAKYLDFRDFPECYIPKDMPQSVIHSHLGAYYAEHVLKVRDQDVINAIRYHTSGRAGMSELEKLVFTADMLEENRSYPEVDDLRKYYAISLEEGFFHCLEEELKHLERKGVPIYKDTLSAYEFYKKQREKKE